MNRKKGISALALKWIAIISMLIDHIGYALAGTVPFLVWKSMRIVGRLAFPIFCFLVVEGFFHTKNVKNYLIRLGVFALISEIPFDFFLRGRFLYMDYQNVFFTLFIGLLLLYLYNRFLANVQPVYAIMTLVSMLCLAFIVKCDYGAEGVLIIYLFYLFRFRPVPKYISVGLVLCLMGDIEPFAILALLPIAFYNGKKDGREGDSSGRKSVNKYFFYCFYPLHLAILGIVSYLLAG